VNTDPFNPKLVAANLMRADWTDNHLSRDSDGYLVGGTLTYDIPAKTPCGVSFQCFYLLTLSTKSIQAFILLHR